MLLHGPYRFGLVSDKHISLLSSYRASWAFSYTRGYFVARVTTDEYTRSLDMFLKGILSAHGCLQVFFEQVGLAGNLGYKTKEEMWCTYRKTCMPVEEHAQSILTPYAFNVFQHELVLSTQYATTEMANGSYVVRHYKKIEGECLVIWIPQDEQIHCSCEGFEHSGILCRHALRLLVTKNCFQVPDKYFPFRWRLESSLLPMDEESTQAYKLECYHSLRSLTDTLLAESLVSKERFYHVQRELTTLVRHVRNMPVNEFAPDSATNNFSEP